MKKNILELKDVSMVYGTVHALRDINLAVREGEWLAIMGPSGSGKTTMMNIIGCMDKPSFGTVILDGQDLTVTSSRDLTEIRRDKIGLIFQQFHLISYLTALENVMMAQYYHSMVDEKEALKALERVGLGQRAKHLPNQLSGGEQQRVCIARALINYPKLILADEPTGNLDGENEVSSIISLSQSKATPLPPTSTILCPGVSFNLSYLLFSSPINVSPYCAGSPNPQIRKKICSTRSTASAIMTTRLTVFLSIFKT